MTRTMVSALVGLVMAAGAPVPAAGQAVSVGASIRVSDNVRIGVHYGPRRGARWVRVYDGYRWRWIQRNGYRHRVFALRHPGYLRQLEREHDRLMRGVYHGTVTHREHHYWHDAVGFTHREFRRGLYRLVRHRYDRVTRRWIGGSRYDPRGYDRDRERDDDDHFDRDRDRDRDRQRRRARERDRRGRR